MAAAWQWFADWWRWRWTGWSALEAIGTVGALLFLLSFERRSHKRAAQDVRRAQAAKVFAWLNEGDDPDARRNEYGELVEDPKAPLHWFCRARNASDAPVYAVTFDVEDGNLQPQDGDQSLFEVGASGGNTGPDFASLAPGAECQKSYRARYVHGRCTTGPNVVLYFKDANAVTWRRDAHGALKEIGWKDHPWQRANRAFKAPWYRRARG